MNYKLHYDALIRVHGFSNRPVDSYNYERHHIIPRSLGGSNDTSNLIYLTGRQHLLAHWLLSKIHQCDKMAMAFFMMRANKSNYVLNKNQERFAILAMQRRGLMNKAVLTPLGSFNSYRDAAAAHKIPESTFQDILRNKTEGFVDLGSERKIVAASEGAHGMSRRIRTPLGIFPFVGAASKAHGISNKTISRRCDENPDEYYYLDPPKQSRVGAKSCNAKQVKTPLGVFASTAAAAAAHGISRESIRSKLRSLNSEYHFINP